MENITRDYAICLKNIANLLVFYYIKYISGGVFLTCIHCLKVKNPNDSLCADYAK